MNAPGSDSVWTGDSMVALKAEIGDGFGGRTVLVTGAHLAANWRSDRSQGDGFLVSGPVAVTVR